MKGVINASAVRKAHGIVFTVAFALLLCLPSAWALGQHSSAPRVPHYSAPRVQPNRQPIRPRSRLKAMSLPGKPTRNIARRSTHAYRPAWRRRRPPASARSDPGFAYQGQG